MHGQMHQAHEACWLSCKCCRHAAQSLLRMWRHNWQACSCPAAAGQHAAHCQVWCPRQHSCTWVGTTMASLSASSLWFQSEGPAASAGSDSKNSAICSAGLGGQLGHSLGTSSLSAGQVQSEHIREQWQRNCNNSSSASVKATASVKPATCRHVNTCEAQVRSCLLVG